MSPSKSPMRSIYSAAVTLILPTLKSSENTVSLRATMNPFRQREFPAKNNANINVSSGRIFLIGVGTDKSRRKFYPTESQCGCALHILYSKVHNNN
jgi:hypothetical protein